MSRGNAKISIIMRHNPVIVQIAGYNIYNLKFRDYFTEHFSSFFSLLFKFHDTCVVFDNTNKTTRYHKLQSRWLGGWVRRMYAIITIVRDACKKRTVIYFAEEIILALLVLCVKKRSDQIYYFKVDWNYDNGGLLKRWFYRYFVSIFDNILFLKSTKVLCFNSAILEKSLLLNKYTRNNEKFSVLYPIIEANRSYPTRHQEFIFFGILRPDQCIDKIIQFLYFIITQHHQDVHMHFFGQWSSNAYQKQIEALVRGYRIDSCVTFYGYVDPDDPLLLSTARRTKFGFAYFEKDISPHTYYAWPSKVIFYLSHNIYFFYNREATSLMNDFTQSGFGIPLASFDNRIIFEHMQRICQIGVTDHHPYFTSSQYQINTIFSHI